jgi:hypothetical protein
MTQAGDPRRSPQAMLTCMLGPLEGARIPGGCDECDAYQTVEPVVAGVWMIAVRHDPDCRWLAMHEKGAA